MYSRNNFWHFLFVCFQWGDDVLLSWRVVLLTSVCSCASCQYLGTNIDIVKKVFCILTSELNTMWTDVSNIWVTRKHRGNVTMTIQYMTLVRVSFHQPHLYFHPQCFRVTWHQLSNFSNIFSDFLWWCSDLQGHSRESFKSEKRFSCNASSTWTYGMTQPFRFF